MRTHALSFFCGFLFSVGLGISEMTYPQRIIGFLDIFGTWDPSMIFVMGGAVGVYATVFFFLKKRESPLWAPDFSLPTKKDIDRPLIIGSCVFGLGWGLSGFCPGPALMSIVTLDTEVLVFVTTMLLGMWAARKLPLILVNVK